MVPLHPAPATATAPPVAATSVAAAAPPAATAAAAAAMAAMTVIMAVEAAVSLANVPLNCLREKRIVCRAGAIR